MIHYYPVLLLNASDDNFFHSALITCFFILVNVGAHMVVSNNCFNFQVNFNESGCAQGFPNEDFPVIKKLFLSFIIILLSLMIYFTAPG